MQLFKNFPIYIMGSNTSSIHTTIKNLNLQPTYFTIKPLFNNTITESDETNYIPVITLYNNNKQIIYQLIYNPNTDSTFQLDYLLEQVKAL